MSFNLIKVIENLGCLTKLKKLYLVQNKVSKIEGLQNLSQLEMLELGANKIRVSTTVSFDSVYGLAVAIQTFREEHKTSAGETMPHLRGWGTNTSLFETQAITFPVCWSFLSGTERNIFISHPLVLSG